MNEITKKKERNNLKESNKQFGLLLKISLIIGILIVSGFITYYVLNPEPGYVSFGILNEDEKAENYPTSATLNETIFFYTYVGNYLNRDFSFQVKIKKGNNQTLLSSRAQSNGTLVYTIGVFTLSHNDDWTSLLLNVSFSELGENQIIIVELWQIKNNIEEYFNNAWMRLNITN
ncbi:hypothetical protein LCGC14_1431690 [marine sediment metagenome]|uniref:DUF1616 domain-containing protein n=1 Tax=marine sediment metagenome TaxID=412755 RepID=A0A0F9M3Y7_9ZZZZ